MNFRIIYVVLLLINASISAPTNTTSLYDKLVAISKEKCPYLIPTPLLDKEQPFFASCTNYDLVRDAAPTNIYTIPLYLCSVYVKAFTGLCNAPKDIAARMVVPAAVAYNMSLNDTCSILSKPPNVILNQNECQKYCANETGALNVCSWSAFMVSISSQTEQLNVSKVKLSKPAEKPEIKVPKVPAIDKIVNKKQGIVGLPSKVETESTQGAVTKVKSSPKELKAVKTVVPEETTVKKVVENTDDTVIKNNDLSKSPLAPLAVDSKVVTTEKEAASVKKPETVVSDDKDLTQSEVKIETEAVASEIEKPKVVAGKSNEDILAPDEIPNVKNRVESQIDDDDEDALEKKFNDKYKNDDFEEKNSFPYHQKDDSNNPNESYFFSYFMSGCFIFIIGYVGYHNKNKIMGLLVEGRRGKRQNRRRPNSASYHKLDSNLEEAVTSSCNKGASNVIY